MIYIKNLTKEFDGITILEHISFNIEKGKIIGLLGKNGVGKTTLLKLLSGLLQATDGEILVLGKNPWFERDKVLRDIGIIIENPIFYEHLTAYKNIELHLEYMNVKADIKKLLGLVGLNNIDKKPVSKFSLGMKQRLGIARAISHSPKLLILDEPINGLDPISIYDIRKLFENLNDMGTTIIISSHILNEIIEIVDDIIILSNKNIEYLGSIIDLKKDYDNNLENYLINKMR